MHFGTKWWLYNLVWYKQIVLTFRRCVVRTAFWITDGLLRVLGKPLVFYRVDKNYYDFYLCHFFGGKFSSPVNITYYSIPTKRAISVREIMLFNIKFRPRMIVICWRAFIVAQCDRGQWRRVIRIPHYYFMYVCTNVGVINSNAPLPPLRWKSSMNYL
jgi:hypothetical protein